jgi:Protein of unknown function (DUF2934)
MMRDKKLVDEITRVAYELYEKRGYAPGNDFADWIEAEQIVEKKHSKSMPGGSKTVRSPKPSRAKAKKSSS